MHNKMRRNIRRILNRKGQYLKCNTYTEWKNHVKEVMPQSIVNKEDFLHWFYCKKRDSEQKMEEVKIILIPLYFALIAIPNLFWNMDEPFSTFLIKVMFVMVVVTFFSCYYFNDVLEQVNFYSDFIEIIENNL